MADFNADTPTFSISTRMVVFSGVVDDPSEDDFSCSICLEPFNSQDPASVSQFQISTSDGDRKVL